MQKNNKFSNKTFCPEVYNQIQIDMQGFLRVCSMYDDGSVGTLHDEHGNKMKVQTHSLIDAMNSKEHKIARLEMSNDIKTKKCYNCLSWEEYSGTSRRLKFVEFAEQGVLKDYTKTQDAFELTNDDGSVDTSKVKLVNLDVRLGNLCNLKCIMCDPSNSSLWYDDWDSLSRRHNDYHETGRSKVFRGGVDPITGNSQFWKTNDLSISLKRDHHGKIKLEGTDEWWESENWKRQFSTIKHQLNKIYFTGGEPMVVTAMADMLDELIASDVAKNIYLDYDTNLTTINNNIINKWKKFKKVSLRVSVDETGERYNIVRNPGNFNKLMENVKTLKEAGIEVTLFSVLCGIANIYGITRVAEFANEMGIPVILRFVNGPAWLNIKNLPKSARQEVIDNLTQKISELAELEKTYIGKYLDFEIKHLSRSMEHDGFPEHIKTFVKTMNYLDELRETDWKNTLDDVADLLRRHCPNLDLNLV